MEPLPIASRRPNVAERPIEADAEPDAQRPHLASKNPAMARVIALAEEVALGDTTVLLSGETGTGKEVLARHIHGTSRRGGRPFVALNCGALPSQLIESELFGHERGAFSGAFERRIGHFEAAHGGTLLLDELSELPLSLQTRLLRVLQEREIMRVGASRPTQVDVRVIATTNRDLREMVERGEFRRDLFYRLNVFPLVLVPLRERMEDLPELARRLLSRLAASFSRSAILTGRALERLMYHDWPGNIRELANVLERALIMSPRGYVDAEAIVFDEDTALKPQVVELPRPLERARSARAVASIGVSAQRGPQHVGLQEQPGVRLKELERETILRTLAQFGGNRTRASAELGISVRTLRYKLAAMRESGVDVPEPSVGV
ncbi:MAG TPA: sigma 54-interacting transcriptional regulator [Myxococcota bacterium]|nr:sigma 54-interacting transcriptional regulator [Myxococcota bacterium]